MKKHGWLHLTAIGVCLYPALILADSFTPIHIVNLLHSYNGSCYAEVKLNDMNVKISSVDDDKAGMNEALISVQNTAHRIVNFNLLNFVCEDGNKYTHFESNCENVQITSETDLTKINLEGNPSNELQTNTVITCSVLSDNPDMGTPTGRWLDYYS
jgi:hypothetical protein